MPASKARGLALRRLRHVRSGALVRLALTTAAIAAGAATTTAEPPPNTDPAFAPWFHSLLQPGTNLSCCSIADCRAADYRIRSDRYEVLIGTSWLPVPSDKILKRADNPTGRAIVCWTPELGILCFVRAAES